MKHIILILVISLLLVGEKSVANPGEIDSLKIEIAKLKDKQQLYDKSIELDKYKYDADFKNAISEIKSNNSQITTVAWIIAGMTFTGLLVFLYQFFVGLKKMADAVFREKLAEMSEQQKDILIKLINEHDEDGTIKKSLKILLVHNRYPNASITKVLKNIGYKYDSKAFSDITGNELEDIIFIDNSDASNYFTDENYDKLLGYFNNNGKGFFYYNDQGVQYRYANKPKIFSFANSLTTIHHNLLDLMRYKWKVIDGRQLP